MKTNSLSSLYIFLLPSLLALVIMGILNTFTSNFILNEVQTNEKEMANNVKNLCLTRNILMEVTQINSILQHSQVMSDKDTDDQSQLSNKRTQINNDLHDVEQKIQKLEVYHREYLPIENDYQIIKSSFLKFKKLTTLATGIHSESSETYIHAADNAFMDFSSHVFTNTEKISKLVQTGLTHSQVISQEVTTNYFYLFAITLLMTLMFTILLAHKLSKYHLEIISSLGQLRVRGKSVPELPNIKYLVKKTRGEMQSLGLAVLEFRDLLALRAEEEARFYDLAYKDDLTGLHNRTFLIKTLDSKLAVLKEPHLQNILIKIDINRFKQINDGMGYEFGDELLKEFAKRIVDFDLANSECFRISADKFAINFNVSALEHQNIDYLNFLSENLKQHLNKPFFIFNKKLIITVNMGVSLYPLTPDNNSLDVLRYSMIALHESKKISLNHSFIYDTNLLTVAENNYQIQEDLEQALNNNELEFYLQSQIHPISSIFFAESLIRWNHPVKGFISPGEFIGVAEESDLIVKIDLWMFKQASEFIVLQDSINNSVHLSVNISGRHFAKTEFVENIKELIAETGVDASKLTLEITESVLLGDLDLVIEKILHLKRLGLQFSIDDFGTGYSSLAYLKKLPVDEIKIDKMFIDNINNNEEDYKLVRAIFDVARIFGHSVVVEGVENQNQLEMLRNMGSPIIQGFIYAKPIPANEWVKQLN